MRPSRRQLVVRMQPSAFANACAWASASLAYKPPPERRLVPLGRVSLSGKIETTREGEGGADRGLQIPRVFRGESPGTLDGSRGDPIESRCLAERALTLVLLVGENHCETAVKGKLRCLDVRGNRVM